MSECRGIATILEGAIREIVREELHVAMAAGTAGGETVPVRGRWVTPPAAGRETGLSEKAIRRMIKEGLVVPRLRNIAPSPKQPKYLVNVDDVVAAAERRVAPEKQDRCPSVSERAARIRAKAGGE